MNHTYSSKSSIVWLNELSREFEAEFEHSLNDCIIFVSATISSMTSSRGWQRRSLYFNSAYVCTDDNVLANYVNEFRHFKVKYEEEPSLPRKYEMLYNYLAPAFSWRRLIDSKYKITLGFSDPFFQFYTYTHPYLYLFNSEYQDIDHTGICNNIMHATDQMRKTYNLDLHYLFITQIAYALYDIIDNKLSLMPKYASLPLSEISATFWGELFEAKPTLTLEFMTLIHRRDQKRPAFASKTIY